MNHECARIADQLRRAFEGKAWHGPSLKELLAEVGAEQAVAKPIVNGHTIWELVSHIEVWTKAALESLDGTPMPKIFGTPEDWPQSPEASAEAWGAATRQLFASGSALSSAIENLSDTRLTEIVPGRPQYSFYVLFHGVVQHSLYHAGQIALVKRAGAGR